MCKNNWKIVPLHKAVAIDTKQLIPNETPDEDFNYIALENIESGTGRLINTLPVKGRSILSGKFIFNNTHVLLGKLRPYLNKVVLPQMSGICSTDILPLKPKNNDLSREWLYLCFRSSDFIEYSRSMMNGVKMPRLRTPDLKKYEILIPTPSEQHRIVQRIEEVNTHLEKARQLRSEAIEQTVSHSFHLKRKIFEELSGDCKAVPLGKCGKVVGGGTPSKKREDYWNGDIPWISAKEMKRFKLVDSTLKITENGLKESSAKMIPAGAVLFVVRGSILFRHVPVAVNTMPCTVNQDMKVILPKKGIDAEYLAHMMIGANDLLRDLVEVAGNTAGKLRTPVWSAFKLPIPSPERQRKIVNQLNESEKKLAELHKLQSESEAELALFIPALLAKAFRGEL